MNLIKYALYALIAFILLLIVAVGFIATTFNPNDYKQQIIDIVKSKKERTLTIDGDISLAYWPKLGVNLGKLAISEHQSDQEFASINSAKVALAVLPLLKKQLVVDTIYIDGAKANIVKNVDGSTNFDDLLSETKEEESEAIKFDIQGINISNSALSYTDKSTGSHYAVSELNLNSSRIALNTPIDLTTNFNVKANQPAINANVNVKGNFLAEPETKHFAAKGLDATINGEILSGKAVNVVAKGSVDATLSSNNILVDDLTVKGSGQFDGALMNVDLIAPSVEVLADVVSSDKVTVQLGQINGKDSMKANLVLANMKGSPKSIESSGISGDIVGVQGARTLNTQFSSPFKGDLEGLIFDLPKLIGQLDIKDPALPNGAVKGDFNLDLHSDIKQEKVNSQFALNLDNTKLNGDVAVAGFTTPKINFNLNAGTLDLNKLLGTQAISKPAASKTETKPADLSALKTLNLNGKVNIATLLYQTYRLTGLNVDILADGQKLSLNGLDVKLDDSKIKGNFSISQFDRPRYSFLIDIDQLDADRYIKTPEKPATETKTDENAPIDLSSLKALNADGSLRIGSFKYGKTKANNIRIDVKADEGVTTVSPLSANLYEGSTNGAIKIDARNTPEVTINQNLSGINIGPLLVDTINNDMLSGKGSLSLNVTTRGNSIADFKKALNGKAAMNLADGAVKGIDIAGSIRAVKSKINILGNSNVDNDATKKTDFSELTASFNIKDGVAHNEDLAMKAPILRLAKGDSFGDIDIANQTINYLAKPTVVKSIKGQGGEELDSLSGIPIPLKITGTFSAPKFGMDFASVGKEVAKSKLVDKVAGDKGEAVKGLLEGNVNPDNLKGLLGTKKSKSEDASTNSKTDSSTEEKPKAEKVLKKLLNF
jgi:AsmA protein